MKKITLAVGDSWFYDAAVTILIGATYDNKGEKNTRATEMVFNSLYLLKKTS